MKLILKEHQVYDKINDISDLLRYIEFNFNVDITFDNREVNNYKLIIGERSFGFSTYNDVINALKFLIESGETSE